MNIIEKEMLLSPNNKDEECAKFTITDTSIPFVFESAIAEGKEYTFSAWVKSSSDYSISIENIELQTSLEWKKINATFNPISDLLKLYFNEPGVYYFYNNKLEVGNVPTDWAPSPEDIEESLSETNARFELVVNKDTLRTEINALADTFSFVGNNFVINAKNLSVDEDGNLKAINGEFIGRIEAKEGRIAEFFLNKNGLYSGTEGLDSDKYGVYVGIDGMKTASEEGSVVHAAYYSEYLDGVDSKYVMISSSGIELNSYKSGGEISYSSISFLRNGVQRASIDSDGIVDREGNVFIDWNGKAFFSYLKVEDNAYFEGSAYLGYQNSYSNGRGVYAPYADNNDHAIIYKGTEGLTSYFGWEGSSEYKSTAILRGQTVKYQNSAGTTTLSDERLKKDFETLDEWDKFFDLLEPCSFKMKNGSSGRNHIGFKAQQVEQALIHGGLTSNDFAGFVKMKHISNDESVDDLVYESAGIQDGDDEYGLIYTEFIAINTYEIQKLKKELMEIKELIGKD